MMSLQLLGASAFGAIIGWFVYYINRYRKGDVQFSDLTTLVGIIGGAGITQLFGGADKSLFGAYGVGLFIGFFAYFGVLVYLVRRSSNFDSDWFLDGRRQTPKAPFEIPGETRPTSTPMDVPSHTPNIIINTAAPSPAVLDTDVAPSNDANQIIAQCEQVWDANKADCNAFVKAVGSAFNVNLAGQANDIVEQIQAGNGWTRLANGLAAKAAADAGSLVIAGLKGSDMAPAESNGHVAVVVSGPLAHGKYPTAYWGKLGGVGRKNTTLNYSWKEVDRDKVIYAARTV